MDEDDFVDVVEEAHAVPNGKVVVSVLLQFGIIRRSPSIPEAKATISQRHDPRFPPILCVLVAHPFI